MARATQTKVRASNVGRELHAGFVRIYHRPITQFPWHDRQVRLTLVGRVKRWFDGLSASLLSRKAI